MDPDSAPGDVSDVGTIDMGVFSRLDGMSFRRPPTMAKSSISLRIELAMVPIGWEGAEEVVLNANLRPFLIARAVDDAFEGSVGTSVAFGVA